MKMCCNQRDRKLYKATLAYQSRRLSKLLRYIGLLMWWELERVIGLETRLRRFIKWSNDKLKKQGWWG